MTPDWLPEAIRVLIIVQAIVLSVLFLLAPTRDLRRGVGQVRYGIAGVLASFAYSTADLLHDPALLRPAVILVSITFLSVGVGMMLADDRRARRTP